MGPKQLSADTMMDGAAETHTSTLRREKPVNQRSMSRECQKKGCIRKWIAKPRRGRSGKKQGQQTVQHTGEDSENAFVRAQDRAVAKTGIWGFLCVYDLNLFLRVQEGVSTDSHSYHFV